MIRSTSTATIIAVLMWGATAAVLRNLTSLVDTRIGTGGGGWGIGQLNPGAQYPFGLMRVGPDTSIGLEPIRISFEVFGGYFYDDTYIECFSHTHLVGAGEGDLQNFGVMLSRAVDGFEKNDAYKSRFTHDNEVAVPGYYAVELTSAAARAEVTVSGTHGAMHRYTCRPTLNGAPCTLIVDMCHGFATRLGDLGSACKRAQVTSVQPMGLGRVNITARVLDAGEFARGQPKIGGVWFYLSAVVEVSIDGVSPVPINIKSWINGTLLDKVTYNHTTSGSLGIAVFAPAPPPNATVIVIVRAGISVVSEESASVNLAAEQRIKSNVWIGFDECLQRATDVWEAQLGLIAVAGGAATVPANMTSFLTALYHVLLSPTTYDGSDGTFIDFNLNVRHVNGSRHFMSDLSIWDVYRTQMPLLLWLRPDVALNVAETMLFMTNQSGGLPKWVLANVETGTMVGHHAAVVLLDWWTKGLRGMDGDVPTLVATLIDKHTSAKLGPLGYIPYETDPRGSSVTLDQAVDCGAVVRCAEMRRCDPPTPSLLACATAYRNVFDPLQLLVLPRFKNGSYLMVDPYTPYPIEDHYTEGNAAEYRWYVPHNASDLLSLFPSMDVAADALTALFDMAVAWPLGTFFPNWGYWAGNEIDLQAPFVFAYMGNEYAHLTQRWVAWALSEYYSPLPQGIPGNDDYGAMSAWVVFSYIGLYPMASTQDYVLVTPQFDTATVSFDPRGKEATPWARLPMNRTAIITIVAHGRPSSGPAYVANATLNGRWLTRPILKHADLVGDGTTTARLDVYLTSTPTVFASHSPRASPYTPQKRRPQRRDLPRVHDLHAAMRHARRSK